MQWDADYHFRMAADLRALASQTRSDGLRRRILRLVQEHEQKAAERMKTERVEWPARGRTAIDRS